VSGIIKNHLFAAAGSKHEELCDRARRWLRGTRKCEPVFSGIGSCAEIPDAIGWSSCYAWRGSTVIECKTSRSDFYSDRNKYLEYREADHGLSFPVSRIRAAEAEALGYKLHQLPSMGDFRFYMCDPGIITVDLVEKVAPDHGLLYVGGPRVRVVRPAPRRDSVDKDSEIRYLRFAIVNKKRPF